MTRFRPRVVDHPLVGKRVNLAGHAAEVTHVNDGLTWVKCDDFATPSVVLEDVAAAMPPLVARASFDYRPGDGE